MSQTSLTRQYNTLLTLTLDNYRKTMVDNIHKAVPYLWWLENKSKGAGIRYAGGGAKIKVQVVNAKNTNTASYSKYDKLNLAATEEMTSTFDDWRSIASTIAISRDEMLDNDGSEEQILDLLETKVKICEMSFREEINRQLVQGEVNSGDGGATPLSFRAGNSGKDLNPLGHLIRKSFANSQTIHGIDQSTADNVWWRNKVKISAATGAGAFSAFRTEMENLYNQCKRGGTNDGIDLILGTQEYYEVYGASLQPNQRFGSYQNEDMTSAGFPNLYFKDAVITWDEYFPGLGDTNADAVSVPTDASPIAANRAGAFWINSQWIEFVIHRKSNYVMTDFIEPEDQTAIYSKLLLRAQQICTQRRKFGAHVGVDGTITA